VSWLKRVSTVSCEKEDVKGERLKRSCVVCGSIEKVELHHIFPKCWKNIPEGYEDQKIMLCHHCHQFMPPFILGFSRSWHEALRICRKLNAIYDDLHFAVHHGQVQWSKGGKKYWEYWIDVHPFKYKTEPFLVHEH
jgi:hypothetical protein